MREIIDYIARSLVENPDEVHVDMSPGRGEIRVELHVAGEDMGRVIGRHGRIANAMRTLMRVVASRKGVRGSLDIV
jgi:hypothetical protein